MTAPYYLPMGQVYGFFVDGTIVTVNDALVMTINPTAALVQSVAGRTGVITLGTTDISGFTAAAAAAAPVQSVAGRTGTVTLTHSDLTDWASSTSGFLTSAPVTSVFGRTGTVVLGSSDVTTALGYTPYNATNPNSYQTAAQVTAVLPVASSTTPAAIGTAAVGTGTTWARADHVHQRDTVAALTSGTINGASVGATTPSTGAFTTLSASGLITPSSTSGIKGTTTNDAANAGSVGEFISATVLLGAAVSLTTATPANVTTISLTAGDWDVWGIVNFAAGGTTTITNESGWINTTSATVPTASGGGAYANFTMPFTTGSSNSFPVGRVRISIASTTTVYLSVQASFGTSTMTAFGFIGARRVR